jgi:DNA helicase-2/ATP-dependent DNA helicase PcrA
MKQALKDCEIDSANFPPSRMLEAVSLLKNALKDVDYIKGQADDFFTKVVARLYARYQKILAANNALDFDDLLLKTAFLLQDAPRVRSELNQRFKFLLVDEYQDTNKAQYRIAKELVIEHGNICVTGDPDQSIYRWRGADIGNILAFEKDWPNATVIRLEENFRSSPNILAVADKLISFNIRRKAKVLIPTKPPALEVVFKSCDDEADEAFTVVEQIAQLTKQGVKLNDIAVFYRINAMSRALEETFVESRVQYQIVRGVEFYNRKEIRDLIAYLKALVNPSDEKALLRIINTPARGIGKTTIQRVAAYAGVKKMSFYEALCQAEKIESLGKAARTKLAVFAKMMEEFKKDVNSPGVKVAEIMERVYQDCGMAAELRPEKGEQGTAADNISELINSAVRYDNQNNEDGSLLDYLQQIALFSDSDAYDASSGSVALMSLHAAKGLEFEYVFIIGLEEGILPHARSSANDEELEEERRLFFVGITRAKAGLYISYAKHRLLRGQVTRSIPSQFLYDVGADSVLCESEQTDYYAEEGPQAEQVDGEFSPGDLVRHEFFGFGRVTEFVNMGDNSVVTVKFDTGQIKTLMLKYANLSKV